MQSEGMGRREFLQASVAGAALIASGAIFAGSSAQSKAGETLKIFVCSVCGHVEFGAAPDKCPACGAGKDAFTQNDKLFTDIEAKGAELAPGHVPVLSVTKTSKLIAESPAEEIAVRIGKKLHPMEATHWIQWADCYVDDKFAERIRFWPSANPAFVFFPKAAGVKVRVVEHCNLHGHWQAEVQA